MHFDTIELVLTLIKASLYAASLFACGSILFSHLYKSDISIVEEELYQHIRKLCTIGVVLVLVHLCVNIIWLSGGEFEALLDPDMIDLVLFSASGKLQILLSLGFAIIFIATKVRNWIFSLLGILTVLGLYILSGHTGAYEPVFLLKPLILIHLLIASFWAGSFVPLLILMKEHDELAAPTLEHFGKTAAWAIPVLLISGLTMSWFIAGGYHGLTETRYGWMLLGKLAIVVLVLGLAGINKFRLVPNLSKIGHGDNFHQIAIKKLRRSIKLEITLVLIVLLATAIFTTLISPAELGHRIS
ncbi:copper resistance D family protein [Kiloniella sp.]|uniref:copper resistance D family protein n=1 Tax=Kiloniella sp. TaxID=1938587 RepID=UPI003B02B5D2